MDSKRTFRLWQFNVSHNQLLIRSPKNEEAKDSRNVDIQFAGVRFMTLPTIFPGLRISEDLVQSHPLITPGDKVFSLESAGTRYTVVAAAMRVQENDLELFETSLEKIGMA